MYTSQLSEPMQLGIGNYPLIHNGQTTNKNVRTLLNKNVASFLS